MLKHAAILAVAVASAVASSQLLMTVVAERQGAARAQTVAVVLPEAPAQGAAAQVSKAADGHFWAQADVNGRWVKFLVDTGASAVALTAADAQRLGIDVADLDYVRPVFTASGQTQAAEVTLDHVTVAGARVEEVKALVVREGLQSSLLGMSYLGRLSRFEATRTALILRP